MIRSQRAHNTRSVEAKQLDDGIGDTLVAAGATRALQLPFPSMLRPVREISPATDRHPVFEQLFNDRGEIL